MRGFSWVALVTMVGLVLAACVGDGEEPAPEEPDTIVFAADQEPAIMNTLLERGNVFANGLIAAAVQEGAYEALPDLTFAPELIDGEAEVTDDPFTVTYRIRRAARWSDGRPVTADDFIFTHQTIMDATYPVVSRDGHDRITGWEKLDDHTVRFTFSQPYAPYKSLFGVVLPKHLLEGRDFNTAWNDTVVGSGPYVIAAWTKGEEIVLERNENYWGAPNPSIDRVVIRFIEDTETQIEMLRDGEVDMLYPAPQPEVVEALDAMPDIEWESTLGPLWERLDMNLAKPGLDKLYVRQAIAHAIDRDAIVEQLITPVNPDAEALHNVIFMANQPAYEPHFDRYDFDQEKAEALLADNGCEKGSDRIYTCDGERLSFGLVFTSGSESRQVQFEIIQLQLKAVGIEVTNESDEAATVLGEVLPDSEWDMFTLAWLGGPEPSTGNEIWRCRGSLNFNGYCDREVTDLLNATDSIVDESERLAAFNEADALIAEDVPTLPLYQRPTLFVWNARIRGPQDNPTAAGPFWNIQEWVLTE